MNAMFFAALYFLQGAAFAYAVNFQKPFLAHAGVSHEALGLFTSALLLPFIFKVAFGYVSDRFPLPRFGARKPYMVLGLTLFGGGYAWLTCVDPSENFTLFASLTWLASLGLAWFDTCADAWAIDATEERGQSAVQAAMISGKSLGLISMAFLFGQLTRGG